jgi:diguanylate cyclase (GGDEF)-like protein
MPLEAQSTIALVNAVGAALTLVANYRFERAERTQYLNLLRENLRNHDIVRANDILSVQSRTDFLTGVLNRRAFDENFYEAFRSCRAEGRPLSVLLADIDHFKAYNDRFGHLEGDKCLIAVARAIAAAVEPGAGFAGRFGGEEFAVVLHGPGFESVPLLTERIRSALTALAIAHPGSRSGYVTLSLGVATLNPSCPESPEDLLLRADAALYRAKRKGRDCAEFDLKVVNN